MGLTKQQKEQLKQLISELSDEKLLELKKGNIEGIKDKITKIIDPDLIAEHTEMKEIIKKEFNRRNKENDAI